MDLYLRISRLKRIMDHFHSDDQYELLKILIFNLEKG